LTGIFLKAKTIDFVPLFIIDVVDDKKDDVLEILYKITDSISEYNFTVNTGNTNSGNYNIQIILDIDTEHKNYERFSDLEWKNKTRDDFERCSELVLTELDKFKD